MNKAVNWIERYTLIAHCKNRWKSDEAICSVIPIFDISLTFPHRVFSLFLRAPSSFCTKTVLPHSIFYFYASSPSFWVRGTPKRERKREISESVAETERREGEKGKQEKKPPADFPIYRTSGNGHGFFLPLLSLSLFHFRFSPPHSSCQSSANTGFILPCAGTSKENSIKYGKKDTIIISSCETFKESLPISTGPGTKSKRFHPHPSPLPPPPFSP